jgi:YfiH family protein
VSEGPYTSLNLTKGTGDDPAAVDTNLENLCRALGLRREYLVSPNQRHTANVRRVGIDDRGSVCPGYDVLVTDRPDVPVLLRFADCTPVLIYDPIHRALAVAHSGWRGTVQGSTRAAVEALRREYGSHPSAMVAAIGPSIGPCCYEVGEDVVDAVHTAFTAADGLLPRRASGRHHFDLWAANRRLLAEAGIHQIATSEVCTACRADEFFSYRASGGRTGHFGALMALRA